MAYIDKDMLNEAMYHEAFEKDSDFQKWDSGCWIRYKLFENVLKSIPTVDFAEGVRCKDCKYHEDGGVPGRVRCPHIVGHWVDADWYCADAKRKETENGCCIQ